MALAPHTYQRADDVLSESVCVCGKHWYHAEHFGDKRGDAVMAYGTVREMHGRGEPPSRIAKVIDALTLSDAKPVAGPITTPTWLPTPPKFRSVEEADAWLDRAEHEATGGAPLRVPTVVVAGNQRQAMAWSAASGRYRQGLRDHIVISGGRNLHQLCGLQCANVYYVGTWHDELTPSQLDNLHINLAAIDAWHLDAAGVLVSADWRGELNRRQHSGAMIASMPTGAKPDLPF